MTRRDFLKGTAGFVLLCGAGFGAKKLKKVFAPSVEDSVGPMLNTDLDILELGSEAEAYLDGKLVFRVNGEGARLLKLADGRHTIEKIIESSGCRDNASSCVDFFITLGKAGYLENRVEVNQFERRS